MYIDIPSTEHRHLLQANALLLALLLTIAAAIAKNNITANCRQWHLVHALPNSVTKDGQKSLLICPLMGTLASVLLSDLDCPSLEPRGEFG